MESGRFWYAVLAIGTLVLFVGAVCILFMGFRGFERRAKHALARTYDGLNVHEHPMPGDVVLAFHTYHGLLIWFTQTEHRVMLPADDAYELLGRLCWFNFRWGLLAYGAVFVPFATLGNYVLQRRSIRHQIEGRAKP